MLSHANPTLAGLRKRRNWWFLQGLRCGGGSGGRVVCACFQWFRLAPCCRSAFFFFRSSDTMCVAQRRTFCVLCARRTTSSSWRRLPDGLRRYAQPVGVSNWWCYRGHCRVRGTELLAATSAIATRTRRRSSSSLLPARPHQVSVRLHRLKEANRNTFCL